MNDINNIKALAEKLIKRGKQKNADEIQISAYIGDNFSISIRKGEIENLSKADSKSISLKVLVDNKVATASSSDLNENTMFALIDDAIERAKLTSPDEFSGLPEKESLKVTGKELALFDPEIPKITPEQAISFARKIEEIALADKRIRNSNGSGFSSDSGTIVLLNSKGFSGDYSSASCSAGVWLQAGEGDDFFEQGWYEPVLRWSQMPDAETIANKAIHRVTRLVGAKKIPTQNVPIVFEPEMTASLLSFLAQCINGHSIYTKRSFLVDKLNEQIGNDLISIIDDGTIPGGFGSRPFDSEGVPTRKTEVMKKGVLKSYLLDTYSAKKLNMKSTGNASGSNNFYLEAGKTKPEDIIKSVKKGLLLTGTIGQGTVATTGDISRGAYGIWIENGELTHPVAEVTISGNLGTILKEIEFVGNDLTFNRRVVGPTVKVKEMTISGL